MPETLNSEPLEVLVSLPTGSAARFRERDPLRAAHLHVDSDPPGRQLGSGGGTAHLLASAWECRAADGTFPGWLDGGRKLVVHGSGESRRLPAYAAEGKPLIPLPLFDRAAGQRLDQVLLDLQIDAYSRLFWCAPAGYRAMVACGDVLLHSLRPPPAFPGADVLIVGLSASPEEAQRHGVLVCDPDRPTELVTFLQKPDAAEIERLSQRQALFLDTGIWLLSAGAVSRLMTRCGWDPDAQAFRAGGCVPYELYDQLGPSLGSRPAAPDPAAAGLTGAVLPLEEARFYHFGTNRSLLASTAQLRRPAAAQRSFGHSSLGSQVEPIVQHARVELDLSSRRCLWVENACVPDTWSLGERHVITGVPPNRWPLRLPAGVCLDATPLAGDRLCWRLYGFDDAFRGALDDPATLWMGRPAADWFDRRGLAPAQAGLDPGADLQTAALFPVLPAAQAGELLAWMAAEAPEADAGPARRWLEAERLSARDLLSLADTLALGRGRHERIAEGLASGGTAWSRLGSRIDLAAASDLIATRGWPSPPGPADGERATELAAVHEDMFRACLARRRGLAEAPELEQQAFAALRRLVVERTGVEPVQPRRNVLADQIVWARSPIRLDLAGGWTDTPPYCLEYGGRVVNLAADLNGQPPVQVFARLCDELAVTIRSIDLGVQETLRSYGELEQWGHLETGFGIARAALALAGFVPRFHAGAGSRDLARQLRDELGGGIELSLLAAVPQGSGLGTSSVLAATLLGALSELLGLGWQTPDLFRRTLALEQMLTSGGGWQDQVGGLARGLKLIRSQPGLAQRLVLRWLPHDFFADGFANRQVLLYYTGLTRVARGILAEIVRGLFANRSAHLGILKEIGYNADFTADALQRRDWDALCEAVQRSWMLNQRLDAGTNPPAVQAILERVAGLTAAAKLLGAGGGGYLLLLARDPEAGSRIRERLQSDPPNDRARFVDLSVSPTGFQVTRS